MFHTRTYDVLRDMPKAPFRGSYTYNVRLEGDDNGVVMNLGVIMKSDDDERQLVGIDLGCSGSRIMVVYFPAHGYPFDDDAPAYDLNTRWRQFEPVPLKYAFVLLAKEPDEAAPRHPMAQEPAIYDSPEFRSKPYSGLVTLFRSMRTCKDAYLTERLGRLFHYNRAMDHICVTIPAPWNSSFQQVYLNVLAEAFNIPRETVHERVTFVTESDAWAHYFLGPLHGGDGYRNDATSEGVVLVLCFGGHMMNGSVFWLGPTNWPRNGPEENGSNRFFRLGDSFGAPGGEELLVQYLIEYVDDVFSTQTGRALFPAEKADVHDRCKRFARDLGPHLNNPSGSVRLEISNAAYNHFWECAYRHPLKVAAEQFALLRRIMRHRKVAGSVMVSGGGLGHELYNFPLLLRLQQLAKDAGLPRPHFERDIHNHEQSSATRGAITMGVGIGVQIKPHGALNIIAQEYRQYKYTRLRSEFERTHFSLLCDPPYHIKPEYAASEQSHQDPKPKSKAERAPIGRFRSYVLFDDLPKAQKRDMYKCEVSMDGSGNNTFMMVKILQTGHLPQRTTHITNLHLRLRFDPGPRRAGANIEPVKVDEEGERMGDSD
ncbi:uncharacterized protein B0T23DRAFT_408728 [Neurospora hispaniola]|uniref:Uncharacterized protein n=1 Tax=Neurospora hispaniola TaxID=588809 RepID=A0AAJ0HY67_9PEZI|nr:hypothetical protein B0T23DRAFT_408728 [Neurospora hispaniola]